MSTATTYRTAFANLCATSTAYPPYDLMARVSAVEAAAMEQIEISELLSEAAVEIENLTDKGNPVAVRLRAKIREMDGAA